LLPATKLNGAADGALAAAGQQTLGLHLFSNTRQSAASVRWMKRRDLPSQFSWQAAFAGHCAGCWRAGASSQQVAMGGATGCSPDVRAGNRLGPVPVLVKPLTQGKPCKRDTCNRAELRLAAGSAPACDR